MMNTEKKPKQPELQKNQQIEVSITDYTQEGLGIGRVGAMAVFVKDTVIGDRVRAAVTRVKATYAYARVLEILEASKDRVKPACPAAGPCGGCQLQMMNYPAQLAFKENRVRSCLTRIGHFPEDRLPMEPIIGMADPWRYRNKAQYPIGSDKSGKIITGFYAGRTHSIIPHDDCLIGDGRNKAILDIIIAHMRQYQISSYDETSGRGLVRHVIIRTARDGKVMVCLVINGKSIPHMQKLTERLGRFEGISGIVLNVNTKNTNVILGNETRTVWGNEYLEDTIKDIRFQISARSFFQINRIQTERLYQTALEYADLSGHETVWDLYCGIGTISLFLARNAGWVYGVEYVPEAIEDAKRNAALNGIRNTSFYAGLVEDILPRMQEEENIHADVIVLDPPRKGCDEKVLRTIISMQPDRIVYVSCDPATLARDLRYLCDNGFSLEKVRPCDMFAQSVHVETVVLLSRKNI